MKHALGSTRSVACTMLAALGSACSAVTGGTPMQSHAVVGPEPLFASEDGQPSAAPSLGRAHNLITAETREVADSWALALHEVVNTSSGYAISMPDAWREVPIMDWASGAVAGVQGFAFPGQTSSLTPADPVLTISIGDSSGSVSLCAHAGYCAAITGRTLDELETALADVDGTVTVWPDTRMITELAVTPTTVDGEPARIRSRLPENQVTGPPSLYSLFLIHDGRPVIVALDYISVNELIGPDLADRILASLRFLD